MNTLSETQKAYLAGFFDADGCVSMTRYKGAKSRTPSYTIGVIVAQKGHITLDKFKAWTGLGNVFENIKKGYPDNYAWRLGPKDACALLNAIMPHLIAKKPQAELVIEYHDELGGRGGHKGRGYVVPPEVVELKEQYYNQLRALKGQPR